MDALRIVFMGTPDFAVATLSALMENKKNVVGVITAPDRPAGRGRKVQESAVKRYALKKNIKVLQPTNLKDEAFLKELGSLNANLQIVVAFRMLPKIVWQMPKYGTFNLHASLLPNYRGAAPINWAIINGETETGVTTFFIDEKIDTGKIILRKKTEIKKEDTAGILHDKLMMIGAELVIDTVKKIENDEVTPVPQSEMETTAQVKDAPKIHKDTCKIDWSLPINDIYNHIRGLSPYPSAWTTLKNGEESMVIKIYDVDTILEQHNVATGELVVGKTELKVAVAQGYIDLREIQLPGKRRMPVKDVLNGLKLAKNAHLL
ncbi:methionyl-tRNA formyltransferase [Costertonia aggregata]|uniref:Methionyl-tRNA formyltransferase n=1 Tax=Costertonia aggregata TaxID=343403 RepID=A0A7H9ATC3_9FLAO|nr:methionyl-tRNA formyltransferase [Costertonia aggregata]QLG46731.1 methionyl-tRNA formyltransferase [Costertonia aggregata]